MRGTYLSGPEGKSRECVLDTTRRQTAGKNTGARKPSMHRPGIASHASKGPTGQDTQDEVWVVILKPRPHAAKTHAYCHSIEKVHVTNGSMTTATRQDRVVWATLGKRVPHRQLTDAAKRTRGLHSAILSEARPQTAHPPQTNQPDPDCSAIRSPNSNWMPSRTLSPRLASF